METERGALVVLAEREPAEFGDVSGVSSMASPDPPSSFTLAIAASRSSTAKNTYGLAPASFGWMPPGTVGVVILAPPSVSSNFQPNSSE